MMNLLLCTGFRKMAEYNKQQELFIITDDELEQLKFHANKLLDVLSNEPMTALLTICFLKEHIENEIGKKVQKVIIK